jgi:hypothetical protein
MSCERNCSAFIAQHYFSGRGSSPNPVNVLSQQLVYPLPSVLLNDEFEKI